MHTHTHTASPLTKKPQRAKSSFLMTCPWWNLLIVTKHQHLRLLSKSSFLFVCFTINNTMTVCFMVNEIFFWIFFLLSFNLSKAILQLLFPVYLLRWVVALLLEWNPLLMDHSSYWDTIINYTSLWCTAWKLW